MRKYPIYQVDAFTQQLFRGNPAGVVLDADGLSGEEMQLIAREFNTSETAFVLSAEGDDHDLWLRYFTPATEVPLCGHATVAAHFVRAVTQKLQPTEIVQKTGAGLLPLAILHDDMGYEIVMTQGELEFSDEVMGSDKSQVLRALRLEERECDSRCPVQVVSAGHSKVMVGVRSREILDAMKPDFQALCRVSEKIGSNGFFVFTFDTGDAGILTTARMFAPAIGIAEDPVTGNGNGPLGAYLVQNSLVKFPENGTYTFTGRQGEAMGRPGLVRVMVDIEKGRPVRTRIGGRAVIVFAAELHLGERGS